MHTCTRAYPNHRRLHYGSQRARKETIRVLDRGKVHNGSWGIKIWDSAGQICSYASRSAWTKDLRGRLQHLQGTVYGTRLVLVCNKAPAIRKSQSHFRGILRDRTRMERHSQEPKILGATSRSFFFSFFLRIEAKASKSLLYLPEPRILKPRRKWKVF